MSRLLPARGSLQARERFAHRAAERIAVRGAVQRDPRDAALDREEQIVAHAGSISRIARPRIRPVSVEKKSTTFICQPYFARSAA